MKTDKFTLADVLIPEDAQGYEYLEGHVRIEILAGEVRLHPIDAYGEECIGAGQYLGFKK